MCLKGVSMHRAGRFGGTGHSNRCYKKPEPDESSSVYTLFLKEDKKPILMSEKRSSGFLTMILFLVQVLHYGAVSFT